MKLLWKIWFNTISLFEPKTTQGSIKFKIKLGIINKDLSPKRCTKCGNKKFEEKVLDTIQNQPCEIESKCSACGQVGGYWAYGSWMP